MKEYMRFGSAVAFCLAVLVLFAHQYGAAYGEKSTTLGAGAVKVLITPKTPIPMSGYGGRKEPFKGVHDDIYARVVIFSDGNRKATIISADVIGFSHDYFEEFAGRIEREAGISKDYILLTAAHNHGGPDTRVYNREENQDVDEYMRWLQQAMVDAVKDASVSMKPVRIGVGIGECLMNINRRARNPKGGISLGRNPYGPCDHRVNVVKISDAADKPVSMLVNWPCHGTVMGPRNYDITGDWPGSASRYIENSLAGCVAPMLIGASGDINPIYGPHIDFHEMYWYSYGLDAIGMDLSEKAINASRDVSMTGIGSISAVQRVITLKAKTDKSRLQQPDYDPGKGLKVRLSALKIGHVVFAGISGELFNEIGVTIRERSPYTYTIVVTHCNGSSGYLVTDAAYKEGGYEANSTRAEPGAEQTIVENLLDMIDEL